MRENSIDLCVRKMNRPRWGTNRPRRECAVGIMEGHMRVECKQSWVEWACGQGTNSPATPLPRTITAPTTSSHNSSTTPQNNKEVDKGRWQNETRWQHMGFSPINQVLTSPTPYPLEPCPFHSTLHCCSWLWFYFYLMCMFT